jgi:leucyl aminopeptidase
VVIVGKIDAITQKAFRQGQIIGQHVNDCRQLSNTPGGDITPSSLAKYAEAIGQKSGVRVNVLGLKKIEELKMGGVLGVGKGSDDEPKFIVMEYKNGGTQKPVVLVGKGVTFDSGGLSIKPGDFMYEMHMDMSGGSAVIHAICAAAKLKIKKNVIAIIPAVENMISGSSFRPGDILKTMSGITVEVLNTDAEGRLILADGLSYAKQFKPRLVVDVATLTGACMVAVGKHASGIFTKDHDLEMIFRDLGEQTGDYVWPLPLWEEYEEEIKGTFADINNAGKTRYGGASTAAAFLYQFAKDYPWVHIDIAPRMTASENEGLEKGAAGAPVRLLIKLLQTY